MEQKTVRLVLENQLVIMETLNRLLHTPGVAAGDCHKKLSVQYEKTELAILNRWE